MQKTQHDIDDMFRQLPELDASKQWTESLSEKIIASRKRPMSVLNSTSLLAIVLALIVNGIILISNFSQTKAPKANGYQQLYQELMIVPTTSSTLDN